MNPNESTAASDICVVCGKDAAIGGGFMHLHATDGRILEICSPRCYEIFQTDSARYGISDPDSDLERELRWTESALNDDRETRSP